MWGVHLFEGCTYSSECFGILCPAYEGHYNSQGILFHLCQKKKGKENEVVLGVGRGDIY